MFGPRAPVVAVGQVDVKNGKGQGGIAGMRTVREEGREDGREGKKEGGEG